MMTIEIDDELGEAALRKARSEQMSLSNWVSGLLLKEVEGKSKKRSLTVAEALGDDSLEEGDFDFGFERDKTIHRTVEFP